MGPVVEALSLYDNIRYHKRSTEQLEAEIGFIMDNVQSVQNLSANFKNVTSTLEYFPDPVVHSFEGEKKSKQFNGDVLIIKVSSVFMHLFL